MNIKIPKTPLIVIKHDGTIIKADILAPTPEGIEIRNWDGQIVSNLQIHDIASISKNEEMLPKTACNNNIALILLKTEQIITEFNHKRTTHWGLASRTPTINRLIIFGSGSLNLTILPERVSHDLDLIAEDERAWMFLRDEIATVSAGKPPIHASLHSGILLHFIPTWESRAATLKGAGGLPFIIVHPLDTISQKLLRTDEKTFREKDQEDIRLILQTLNPEPKAILTILQEGYMRFFNPNETEINAAIKNTNWFLNTFLPNKKIQEDIITPAMEKREELLLKQGMIPAPPTQWSQILDNEPKHNRSLLEP
jgi:hypothetical protein